MPDGLCTSSEARRAGSQTSCAAAGRSFQVKAISCGPAETGIGGEVMTSSTASCATLMPSAERMQIGTADGPRVDDLAVHHDEKLVRDIVALDAEQSLLDAAHEPAGEDVLGIGREVVRDLHTAAGAERHAFEMIVLGHLDRNLVGRRRYHRVRIAEGVVGHAQGDSEIALEQHRRRRQHLGDVIEAVVAAVTRQQRREIGLDAEQIADRIGVLGAIQAMHLRRRRVRRLAGCRVERADERRQEFLALLLRRLGNVARRHEADVELVDHLFPDGRIGMHIRRIAALEGQLGREIDIVVAIDAIALDHRPLTLELGLRRTGAQHPDGAACHCDGERPDADGCRSVH